LIERIEDSETELGSSVNPAALFEYSIYAAANRDIKFGRGYDSLLKQILPQVCVNGSVTNATPNARGWTTASESGGVSYEGARGSSLAGTFLALDTGAQAYFDAKVGNHKSFMTSMDGYIDAETFRLDAHQKVKNPVECGDAFIKHITFGAATGFVFRVDFDDEYDRLLFERSFAPNLDRPFDVDDALLGRMQTFLAGRAKIGVTAVHAGGNSGDMEAILKATSCSVKNLRGCDRLILDLRNYIASFPISQANFPLPLGTIPLSDWAEIPGWAPTRYGEWMYLDH
jgi:hypothetical protein